MEKDCQQLNISRIPLIFHPFYVHRSHVFKPTEMYGQAHHNLLLLLLLLLLWLYSPLFGDAVAYLVEALSYKPEGRGFGAR
jgi:hypothetical protein